MSTESIISDVFLLLPGLWTFEFDSLQLRHLPSASRMESNQNNELNYFSTLSFIKKIYELFRLRSLKYIHFKNATKLNSYLINISTRKMDISLKICLEYSNLFKSLRITHTRSVCHTVLEHIWSLQHLTLV